MRYQQQIDEAGWPRPEEVAAILAAGLVDVTEPDHPGPVFAVVTENADEQDPHPDDVLALLVVDTLDPVEGDPHFARYLVAWGNDRGEIWTESDALEEALAAASTCAHEHAADRGNGVQPRSGTNPAENEPKTAQTEPQRAEYDPERARNETLARAQEFERLAVALMDTAKRLRLQRSQALFPDPASLMRLDEAVEHMVVGLAKTTASHPENPEGALRYARTLIRQQ